MSIKVFFSAVSSCCLRVSPVIYVDNSLFSLMHYGHFLKNENQSQVRPAIK